ncbi:MAG: hypothetical protein ACYCW6_25085 [Candidatus Xenobia bacterium]
MERRPDFKPLAPEAIPAALSKAELLRQHREAYVAESICRDVLRVEPENQEAVIRLILSITDQFLDGRTTVDQARKFITSLHSEYDRAYYTGVIFERWARSQEGQGIPGSVAVEWYVEAMRAFDKAHAMRPPNNEEALLRWNSCLRSIRSDERLKQHFSNFSLSDPR